MTATRPEQPENERVPTAAEFAVEKVAAVRDDPAGLLDPPASERHGSPWWRAVNERLLQDTAEARAHVLGMGGPISCSSARWSVEFAEQPSAQKWYRAHNATIVSAYLDHRELAEAETHAERFFINLILVRALYAATPSSRRRGWRSAGCGRLLAC